MRTNELAQHLLDELSPLLGTGEAQSVARLVLEDLFGWRRGHRPRRLTRDEELLAWTTLNRLKAGEPVQYVTGIADFYGLQLKVTPAVLIPRPETEELVEWILEENQNEASLRLWDLGSGSGCIPLAIASKRPAWNCLGSDVSQDALDIARHNAGELALDLPFIEFDLLNAVAPPSAKYDIICSNPPYIPPSERGLMSASTLAHEPALALFVPEEDALLFYRKLGEIAQSYLSPIGTLFVETNEYNNEEVAKLYAANGFTVARKQDLQGKWRMVKAQKA